MASCYRCGGRIRVVAGGLYKCQMCGAYNQIQGAFSMPSTMRVFTSFDRVKAATIEGAYEQTKGQPSMGDVAPDMVEFISRLATTLSPIEGYTPDIQGKQLELRKSYVKQLNDVFDGKMDFQAWFDKTKTKRSLARDDLIKMIYDALEGLQSEEAQGMRAQYEAMLTKSMF